MPDKLRTAIADVVHKWFHSYQSQWTNTDEESQLVAELYDTFSDTGEELRDQGYADGRKRAALEIFAIISHDLGVPKELIGFLRERGETVLALRRLCRAYGDDDWPDDLYLPDVIEKHLERYLSD